MSLDALRGFDMFFIMGGEALLPKEFYIAGYWACYVAVCWLFLYILYIKKIFLKV